MYTQGPFSYTGYLGFGYPSSRRRARCGCRGSAATSRAALKADARRAALSNHRKGACACRTGIGTARGGSTRSRETAEGSAYSANTGICRVFTIPTVYAGIYPSRFVHTAYLSTHYPEEGCKYLRPVALWTLPSLWIGRFKFDG